MEQIKKDGEAMPYNDFPECVLMKVFYFGLSKNTQQMANALFVGGILRNS